MMGYTSKSGWQIDNLIAEMKLRYRGHDYHMYLNNCITFSDDLCFQLTNKHVPAWLNRLPRCANRITCCLPRYLRGPYPATAEGSESGNEKVPILPPKANNSGFAIPSGDSSSKKIPAGAAKILGTSSTTSTTEDDDGSVPKSTSSSSAVL